MPLGQQASANSGISPTLTANDSESFAGEFMKAVARSRAKTQHVDDYGTGFNRSTPLDDLPELCTVEEAADAIGTAANTIYESIRRRELPHTRFGRLIRIHREGLRPGSVTASATTKRGAR